jgi:hypothetical protein
MSKFVAASALVFAFATSAEARTQHHHYRHYAAHHYRHYAYHHYRQQPQEFGFSNFGSGSGFGSESGFGSGFGSGFRDSSFENSGRRRSRYERSSSGQTSYRSASVGGRPGAWCGWYMRQQVGADPGPQYNLARSWAHYGGNAGGPSVGTIVVWSHHVGKIVGRENGQWIVESGNDGHAIRTRPRSLAGAIAFRNAYASF